MAGTFSLFSKVNSSQNIRQALINASKPKIVAAAQMGAEVGPRLIAAYAASVLKPNDRVRSTPSLTSPSAYEGIVAPTRDGATLRLKVAEGSDDFKGKFYRNNNGGGAHPIFARIAPKLVFKGTNQWEGQTIKIDVVTHPATEGKKFFQKGAKDTYQVVLDSLK